MFSNKREENSYLEIKKVNYTKNTEGQISCEELSDVKEEPSVQFILVLPSENKIIEQRVSTPEEIKEEVKSDDEAAPFNEESLKVKPELEISDIKHEPSVQFLLILPPAEDNDGKTNDVPLPKVIKSEKRISKRVKDVLKILPDKKSKTSLKNGRVCKFCHRKFYRSLTLKVHLCEGRKNKKPVCEYCNKEFKHFCALRQHIAIHLDELKDPCDICGKVMVKLRLAQHKKTTHSKFETRFECDLCPTSTKFLVGIEMHMNVHIKPFQCKTCKKMFSEQRYFNEHVLNHKKPNPFKCQKCSNGYTRLTSLTRHIQTAHSIERKFPCKECSYPGKTQDGLTNHIKTHSKAYQCDVCCRKFSRLTMLNQHRVLHDNPNTYQCKICKKSYTQKRDLRNHLKKKHNESDEEDDG